MLLGRGADSELHCAMSGPERVGFDQSCPVKGGEPRRDEQHAPQSQDENAHLHGGHRRAAADRRRPVGDQGCPRRVEERRQRAAGRDRQQGHRRVQRFSRVHALHAARPDPQRAERRQARLRREDRRAEAWHRRSSGRRVTSGERRGIAAADRGGPGKLLQEAPAAFLLAARRPARGRGHAARRDRLTRRNAGGVPRRDGGLARHPCPADSRRHPEPRRDALRAHRPGAVEECRHQRSLRQDRVDPRRRPGGTHRVRKHARRLRSRDRACEGAGHALGEERDDRSRTVRTGRRYHLARRNRGGTRIPMGDHGREGGSGRLPSRDRHDPQPGAVAGDRAGRRARRGHPVRAGHFAADPADRRSGVRDRQGQSRHPRAERALA